MATTRTIFTSSNDITISSGRPYIITGYVKVNSSGSDYLDINNIYLAPTTMSLSELTTVISTDGEDALGRWVQISTLFTKVGSTLKIGLYFEVESDATTFSAHLDSVTVNGPIVNLTEELEVEFNRDCNSQNIYLTWLNHLGGWEYWNFTARKEYGVEMGEVRQIRRDIFSDWDTTFIDGDTQDDYTKIEAYDTILVRSQPLTLDQLNGIKHIKTSIKVQDITSGKRTVLVEKDSYKIYQDRDKNYFIEFSLRYTDNLPIQTQ